MASSASHSSGKLSAPYIAQAGRQLMSAISGGNSSDLERIESLFATWLSSTMALKAWVDRDEILSHALYFVVFLLASMAN